MNKETKKLLKILKTANTVCPECGNKYGEDNPMVFSTTYYMGTCDVCKEKKVVTEVRDYSYLVKGIKELMKEN